MSNFTIPGLNQNDAKKLIDALQERLTDYNDLHLILKHAHWNVVGENFIGVHEMLDPQVELVRGFADEVAERIAALGGEPIGTPLGHAEGRKPLTYDLNRGTTIQHIAALNDVYSKVIEGVRETQPEAAELDPMTEDLLVGQSRDLEQFQWFLRSHLQDENGNI